MLDNWFVSAPFRCVISTLCLPNLEFQFVNPTTQVALFSVCTGACSSILNITWNIYQGAPPNGSSTVMQWTLFNQTDLYENIWLFGECLFRNREVAQRCIQVDTPIISPLFSNYSASILGLASGNSKWPTRSMQRIPRVPWRLKSTNPHRTGPVRSTRPTGRPVLSSLFHVRIGPIKMKSKTIPYTVRGKTLSLTSVIRTISC